MVGVEEEKGTCTHLTNWLAVRDGVGRLGRFITAEEVVRDKSGTECLDHQVVVVQRCDYDGGRGACEGSGDLRGRHFDIRADEVSLNRYFDRYEIEKDRRMSD